MVYRRRKIRRRGIQIGRGDDPGGPPTWSGALSRDLLAALSGVTEAATSDPVSRWDYSPWGEGDGPTPRWTRFDRMPTGQVGLWLSEALFRICPSGRRSGKSELFKRALMRAWICADREDWWGVASAPTHQQAKRIFWADLKKMAPPEWIEHCSESELTLRSPVGAEVTVLGLDRPERIEGRPLDLIGIDEFATCKPELWDANILPALYTEGRPHGKAWLFGVPEIQGIVYRDLWRYAIQEEHTNWAGFRWHSSEVLAPEVIAERKSSMDPVLFAQEFEGSFESPGNSVYHCFAREDHAVENVREYYISTRPLIVCFDFNVSPGVALILQEHTYRGLRADVDTKATVTMAMDEVWIAKHSNSQMVARKIAEQWGTHKGEVWLDGDATGGIKGTQSTIGSDWDIIREILHPVFGTRLKIHPQLPNPPVRRRINTVNARLRSADGTIRLLVDPRHCEHLADDLEFVTVLKGSAGEIDKKSNESLTHISDALGYYLDRWFQIGDVGTIVEAF